ncbi:MAG TPA: hypothetical protein VI277_01350 [Candidatus Limnocylindria bacterium]
MTSEQEAEMNSYTSHSVSNARHQEHLARAEHSRAMKEARHASLASFDSNPAIHRPALSWLRETAASVTGRFSTRHGLET